MKLILSGTGVLPALLLTVLLVSSGSVQAATATNSTQINVSAKVLASTCIAPGAITLDLGNVSLTDLNAVGNETGNKNFALSFTGCDASIKTIVLTAAGAADSKDSTAFGNTLSSGVGVATGVAIELYPDNKSTPLTPAGGTYTYSVTGATTHSLSMSARVRATATGATAGDIKAVIPLSVTYP